jgi:hypothetical protein
MPRRPAHGRGSALLSMAVLMSIFLGSVQAQQMEIIPLRNRTAEELMPILRPLVEPGGALTGMQYQLILRASPNNVADIRRVVSQLDVRQRRLQISVRQDADGSQEVRSASAGARVILSPGASSASIDGRLQDDRRNTQDRVSQTVQVIEGGIATINVGQSMPVPSRIVTRTVNGVLVQDTTSYRDVGTGFQVLPRLSGDRVTLEINPQRDTPGPGGTVNIQRAQTTVSGRLGEWMELGGSSISESRSGSGILSSSAAERSDRRSIWVKVDELP